MIQPVLPWNETYRSWYQSAFMWPGLETSYANAFLEEDDDDEEPAKPAVLPPLKFGVPIQNMPAAPIIPAAAILFAKADVEKQDAKPIQAVPQAAPRRNIPQQAAVQPQRKGFFDSGLWQGIKIGLPIALGFALPGIGFLAGTALVGGVSAVLSLTEKLTTKQILSREDAFDIGTDFGMGFLGGALSRLKIFNGAKTYLSAFRKSAAGGFVSGGVTGTTGQIIKDVSNHGQIDFEKALQVGAAGALGGAAFGGAFGVYGRYRVVKGRQKKLKAMNGRQLTRFRKTRPRGYKIIYKQLPREIQLQLNARRRAFDVLLTRRNKWRAAFAKSKTDYDAAQENLRVKRADVARITSEAKTAEGEYSRLSNLHLHNKATKQQVTDAKTAWKDLRTQLATANVEESNAIKAVNIHRRALMGARGSLRHTVRGRDLSIPQPARRNQVVNKTKNKWQGGDAEAQDHYNVKHKAEFPELKTWQEYAEAARQFGRRPPRGALVMFDRKGDTIIFDPRTKTIGMYSPDGVPGTFFRMAPKSASNPRGYSIPKSDYEAFLFHGYGLSVHPH